MIWLIVLMILVGFGSSWLSEACASEKEADKYLPQEMRRNHNGHL